MNKFDRYNNRREKAKNILVDNNSENSLEYMSKFPGLEDLIIDAMLEFKYGGSIAKTDTVPDLRIELQQWSTECADSCYDAGEYLYLNDEKLDTIYGNDLENSLVAIFNKLDYKIDFSYREPYQNQD